MRASRKAFNVKSTKERMRRYRRYVYVAGAVHRPDKGHAAVIDEKVMAKERKNDFNISRTDRFINMMISVFISQEIPRPVAIIAACRIILSSWRCTGRTAMHRATVSGGPMSPM